MPHEEAPAAYLYSVRFLRAPIVPLSFPSTAERDRYLGLWREGCRNAEVPLPAEGTDFELINLEGTQ
jgi:hypothetical protein